MLEQAPLMSDAGRWKTMMYEIFWLGQEPKLTAEEQRQAQKRRTEDAKAAIGTPVKDRELEAMNTLLERARQLREEQKK
jgi:hypothetical protein